MRKKSVRVAAMLIVIVVSFVAFAVGGGSPREASKSDVANPQKPKKLRELAKERDVQVEGPSGCEEFSDIRLAHLSAESKAIIHGRIIDERSYFDDSGGSLEDGEYITTEYNIEVLSVLRDRTLESLPPPNKPQPAPLTIPLRVARNGGVVYVNGHRASVWVKEYDDLHPGREYVFFLNWASSYKAYIPTACSLGVLNVTVDHKLRPLGSPPKLTADLRDVGLSSLLNRLKL